ncbi:MAG TPA: hypothetical protein PK961_04660 [bacterium]|nr:hypothetical protein [bacterium]
MRRLYLMPLILCLSLLVVACAPEDEEDDSKTDESVRMELIVDEDDVFGFVPGADMGTVVFSDTDGLVGSRIKMVVEVDEIDRFQDQTLTATLELTNKNAIQEEDYVVTFDVRNERTEYEFYIPQIWTVPTILNFEFSLHYEEDNTEGGLDVFTAKLDYWFKISQGTPAT